jgi:hypothetical protein
MSPVGESRNGATFTAQAASVQKPSNLKNPSKTITTGLKMPSKQDKLQEKMQDEIVSP